MFCSIIFKNNISYKSSCSGKSIDIKCSVIINSAAVFISTVIYKWTSAVNWNSSAVISNYTAIFRSAIVLEFCTWYVNNTAIIYSSTFKTFIRWYTCNIKLLTGFNNYTFYIRTDKRISVAAACYLESRTCKIIISVNPRVYCYIIGAYNKGSFYRLRIYNFISKTSWFTFFCNSNSVSCNINRINSSVNCYCFIYIFNCSAYILVYKVSINRSCSISHFLCNINRSNPYCTASAGCICINFIWLLICC